MNNSLIYPDAPKAEPQMAFEFPWGEEERADPAAMAALDKELARLDAITQRLEAQERHQFYAGLFGPFFGGSRR